MAAELPANTLSKMQHFISGSKDDKVNQMAKTTVLPDEKSRLTTDYGVLQNNTDEWLRVTTESQTGPMLLEDPFGREKIHRFDHERIPERVVHARGAGAFGTFKLFESAADVSHAGVLTDTSRITPVFVRFSTVLGSRGSADTVRDVRGFAVKFYTQEGNWDLVGNNIPVFFIQDAMKFPDLIHAGKPEPHIEVPQAQTAHNNFWDFVYLHPEATHMYLWAMSDRAIPRSYRMMQGFGVNTFTLVNAKGERSFVKFHFTPELGVHSLIWDEALKIAGQDPDFHRKDLAEAIEAGAFPKWKFGIQVIPEAKEHEFDFDILDATKLWPEDLVPVRYIGELELNRNPDEYFPQTEQGRNFSYFDTQISRLGINWEELPINRPVCPVMNFNRDGAMRHTIARGKVNYWPNRFQAVPPASQEEGAYIEHAQRVEGIKQRSKSIKFRDHFSQAQLFFNSLSGLEKTHIMNALSFELDHCEEAIVYERLTQRLADIDLGLAQSVGEMVGASMPQQARKPNHGKTTKNVSQMDFLPEKPTIATRKVAILVADGYDALAFNTLKAALVAAQAIPVVIGPRRSEIFASGVDKTAGNGTKPDHHLEGFRSTLVDAVFVPGGVDSVASLSKNGRALHWIREAFGHLKPIGATGEGVKLVKDALLLSSLAVSLNAEVVESYGVITMNAASAETWKEKFEVAKNAPTFLGKFFFALSMHRVWQRELDGLSGMVAY